MLTSGLRVLGTPQAAVSHHRVGGRRFARSVRQSGSPVATAVLLVAAGALAPQPAQAHPVSAGTVTALDAITPPLPPDVVVQVRASVAAQLVVSNPTSTRLSVLSDDGRPWLRVSSAGVRADVSSPEWAAGNIPEGQLVARRGRAQWVRVSTGSSWGWFDHHLHPASISLARAAQPDGSVLARWVVPLQYGDERVSVTGTVTKRELLGGFQVVLEHAPPGMQADVLQGRLPGVFARGSGSSSYVISGSDGRPFATLSPRGVSVRTASPTWQADQQARSQPVVTTAASKRVSTTPALTWLDPRLAFPADRPGPQALAATRPVSVQTWSIPVTVDGRPDRLSGRVEWVPVARPASSAGWAWLLLGAAALVLGALVARGRRGRKRGPAR